MRPATVAVLLLPHLTGTIAVRLADLLRCTSSCPSPIADPGVVLHNLDLRDVSPVHLFDSTNKAGPNANPAAPDAAAVANLGALPNPVAPNPNPAAPAVPGNPGLNFAAAPGNPAPGNSVPPAPADPARLLSTRLSSTTVQWIETWIGGTQKTWVPKTVTFSATFATQTPYSGKSEIGIRALKGEVSVAQTVSVGSAPTMGAEWMVALAGIGVVLLGAL